MLAAVDHAWSEGFGLRTAIVIQTSEEDASSPGVQQPERLTLYAERDGRCLRLGWDDGRLVRGWPTPSLEAVLALAGTAGPDDALMSVTRSGTWSGFDATLRQSGKSPFGDAYVESSRLVSELLPSRRGLLGASTRWPRISGERLTLPEAETEGFRILAEEGIRRTGTRSTEPSPGVIQRLDVVASSLTPTHWTVEVFDENNEVASFVDRRYGPGVAVRDAGFEVPLGWVVVHQPHGARAIPHVQHHRLLPFPDTTLDASWFTDPRERWPDARAASASERSGRDRRSDRPGAEHSRGE